jgi:hypothetical protein
MNLFIVHNKLIEVILITKKCLTMKTCFHKNKKLFVSFRVLTNMNNQAHYKNVRLGRNMTMNRRVCFIQQQKTNSKIIYSYVNKIRKTSFPLLNMKNGILMKRIGYLKMLNP